MSGLAKLEAVASYLPGTIEKNRDLSIQYPKWDVNRVADKIGIEQRHIAGPDEYSSTLAIKAAEKLFGNSDLDPRDVDYLILVTQSPDFFLPTTAALVHKDLGLREDCGAVDLNLGCSGYVAALGFAKGIIDSGQSANVLVVTSDTYSKFVNPADRAVRTIFGDGSTATWVSSNGTPNSIGRVLVGTDGSGAGHLLVPSGGMRSGEDLNPRSMPSERGLVPSRFDLFMDGREIFNFTLRISGDFLGRLLADGEVESDDIDYFIFHQANAFMISHLREKLNIPEEKVPVLMSDFGNTVSGTIPMVLERLFESKSLKENQKVVLFGFGVGLSWAGTVLQI